MGSIKTQQSVALVDPLTKTLVSNTVKKVDKSLGVWQASKCGNDAGIAQW